MTERVKRIKEHMQKVREMRCAMIKANRLVDVYKCDCKMKELEAKLHEAEMYEPTQLRNILSKEEMAKHNIYGKLLKINLAADFLTDCADDCRDTLRKLGINNMHFQKDLDEISKLSARIAGLIATTEESSLTDFIVDDDEFISDCNAAASRYLAKTFNLES